MEFEKDPSITDEQRILAATKTVTIKPLSANIMPDVATEPITIAERQPNVERDSEDTADRNTLLQPSKGTLRQQPHLQPSSHRFVVIPIVAAILIGLMGVATIFVALT